jgi:predicted nucleotidyltransferase
MRKEGFNIMTESRLADILHTLRQEFSQALGDQLESMILFGSQARDQAHPESDIDVLVVVRDDSDYGDLMRKTSPIVAALSLEYDVVISRAFVARDRFERERSPFLLNVWREGVIL